MASALQCPACGFKHRLTALTGDPVFSCEQCGRLLKTPVEYRRPEPSAPSEPPRPSTSAVERGGSATRDQTSVLRTGGAPAAGETAARPRRPMARPPATLAVPAQILGWVVAVVLGGVIVRYLARFTGLLTGDSIIDIITGSGWGRYARLFAVVPFWALVAAGLMTLFVEGGRWWQARSRASLSGHPVKRSATPAAAKPSRPSSPSARPPAQSPTAPESRSPAGAAATPRARRIPKRDISS